MRGRAFTHIKGISKFSKQRTAAKHGGIYDRHGSLNTESECHLHHGCFIRRA